MYPPMKTQMDKESKQEKKKIKLIVRFKVLKNNSLDTQRVTTTLTTTAITRSIWRRLFWFFVQVVVVVGGINIHSGNDKVWRENFDLLGN